MRNPIHVTLDEYCPSEPNLELEVLKIARRLTVFTSDDLHVLEPSIEKLGRDKRVLGSTLATLQKHGSIVPVHYVKSQRKVCHNRPVMQWQYRGQ